MSKLLYFLLCISFIGLTDSLDSKSIGVPGDEKVIPLNYNLLQTAPGNDDPEQALSLNCGASIEGTTISATVSGMDVFCPQGETAPDVFYSFIAYPNVDYSITLQGEDFDGALTAYTQDFYGGYLPYCSNSAPSGGAEIVEPVVIFPHEVLIQVQHVDDEPGDFQLSIDCEIDYDEPCDALEISCGETVESTTYPATQSDLNPGCANSPVSDVFFKFSASPNDVYEVSVTGGNYDGLLAAYTNACEGPIEEIACSDNSSGDGTVESISFSLDTPQEVFIQTGDQGTDGGQFELSLDCSSVLDCPELGMDIGDDCDDGDPSTGNDEVTANCECQGTTYDCPNLQAYFGDSCDDDNPNTSNDSITEDCECQGDQQPTYDECSDAYPLEVSGEEFSASNLGASGNIWDIECFAFPTEVADVWFSFVAPEDGNIIIETTAGSMQNSHMHIYNSCAGGFEALEGCDDDGGEGQMSKFVFDCGEYVPGDTYFIQVDGESPGTFGISVSQTMECVDCPGLEADIGDPCNDEDPFTENDIVNEDCQCEGTPASVSMSILTVADCQREIWVGFFEPGTSTMAHEYSGSTDPMGDYGVSGIEAGYYDVYVSIDGYLQKAIYNSPISPGTNNLEFNNLQPGDVNGDNTIGPLDLSILISGYNSNLDEAGYSLSMDFDCDDQVGPLDLSQLISNYGLSGDSFE